MLGAPILGEFLKDGIVPDRLKNKFGVKKSHLTKTQKISAVRIRSFQMERVYIFRDCINSSSEGCRDTIKRQRTSILFQITLVQFSPGFHQFLKSLEIGVLNQFHWNG